MMVDIPVLSINLCTNRHHRSWSDLFLDLFQFVHLLATPKGVATRRGRHRETATRKTQTATDDQWKTEDTTFNWSVGGMSSVRLLNPYLGTYINCLLLEALSICRTNWSRLGLSSLARDRQCNLSTWMHNVVGSSVSVRQQISSFQSTLLPAENTSFWCRRSW